MSYKTDRLTALFPDAYAARDKESLLYKLLDAIGAEFMEADGKIKTLLKSHWVRYASGAALDGLAAAFGVERRLLRDGSPEPDDAFRRRLQSVVPFFTGGGTVQAVLGAVRSALGLPFDLDQLRIPAEYKALRDDIEKLVSMREFSPVAQRVLGVAVHEVNGASELTLVVDLPTVGESRPTISWTFDKGSGRRVSLERIDSGAGVESTGEFVAPAGSVLLLAADADGILDASLNGTDVTSMFTNLNGSRPPVLPPVPVTRSEWKFRARGGVFDLGVFDRNDTFDLPLFRIELSLLQFQPLTFDVLVPYLLQKAVADLKARYNYPGELLVFQGLPLERIQEVIDQTRAAGVRGSIQFSLNFVDVQEQREAFSTAGDLVQSENADATDSLLAADINENAESQDAGEKFAIGAVFNVSKFDQGFGFL